MTFRLRPVLAITALPGLRRLASSRMSAYPNASQARLALPRVGIERRNINLLPFRRTPVRMRLRTG